MRLPLAGFAGAAVVLAAALPLAAQESPPVFGERVDVEVVNVDVGYRS